jgi:hypothetical protein
MRATREEEPERAGGRRYTGRTSHAVDRLENS